MKLRVGLIGGSRPWEQFCRQEGVPFSRVDLNQERIEDTCSLLIIDRPLLGSEPAEVQRYLGHGGAIIGYANHLVGFSGTTVHRERLDYLIADDSGVFSDTHILDLGIVGAIPKEANCLWTQLSTKGAFTGVLGGGPAVLLPFDPAEALADERSANKSFYFTRDRLPAERVSLVAKGEVRQLLHRAFEYLHGVRGLPYAHLWYFPDGKRNLFAFRVDTDGALQKDIDELYWISRDNALNISWYLDVRSHQSWLRHFTTMVDHEIGLHCYEHITYTTYDANLENIRHAKQEMELAGLTPVGFTAPFGTWNRELGKAIDEIGFEYSSEFSLAYDTLPLFHVTPDVKFKTMQIPIHPICIGSMKRVGYSAAQMKEYFRMIIDLKLARSEPLFFYHHPTHHAWDVVKFMFDYIGEQGITSNTLIEYARWWKGRINYKLDISIHDGVMETRIAQHTTGNLAANVFLRIVNPDGREAFVLPKAKIDVKNLPWVENRILVPPPDDMRRIREFDPRSMLGDLVTGFMRRFK